MFFNMKGKMFLRMEIYQNVRVLWGECKQAEDRKLHLDLLNLDPCCTKIDQIML
jgi:hypothetical protein